MLINLDYLLVITFIILITFFFSKFSFLKDNKNLSIHKKFIKSKNNPPLIGGIILLLVVIIFIDQSYIYKLFLILFLILGVLSDLNVFSSPKSRLVFQLVLILFYVSISQIFIESVRIDFFDHYLSNIYFKIFFTSFCFLIIINGTNFIDGLNTLSIGYFLIVLIFLKKLQLEFNVEVSSLYYLNILILSLSFILLLNLFDFLYLGDSGAYILALIIGTIGIITANNYSQLSPYYVVNLLWYPAYETFFSIIRKLLEKKSTMQPDNEHLHQLFYRFFFDKLKGSIYSNPISAIVINFYNLLIFYLGFQNFTNTKYQIILTVLSIAIYSLLYLIFKKKYLKKNYK